MRARHKARKAAACLLYARDMSGDNPAFVLEFLNTQKVLEAHKDFVSELLAGVSANLVLLDGLLESALKDFERLSKPELAILRLSAYELFFTLTDKAIIINEAIELGKHFGSENSAKLINAVLDKLKSMDIKDFKPVKKTLKSSKNLKTAPDLKVDLNLKKKEGLKRVLKERTKEIYITLENSGESAEKKAVGVLKKSKANVKKESFSKSKFKKDLSRKSTQKSTKDKRALNLDKSTKKVGAKGSLNSKSAMKKSGVKTLNLKNSKSTQSKTPLNSAKKSTNKKPLNSAKSTATRGKISSKKTNPATNSAKLKTNSASKSAKTNSFKKDKK